jgi:phosphatidate cytidylyltransferase
MVPLAIVAVWLGSWGFAGLLLIAACLVLAEWVVLTDSRPNGSHPVIGWAGIAAALVFAALDSHWSALAVLTVTGAAMALQVDGAARRGRAFAGVFYAGLPVVALVILRAEPGWGLAAVIWVMLIAWATDIFAYVGGRAIGGPKLWPAVSPNKTWAGLICGMAAVALAAWLFAVAVAAPNPAALGLFGAALALVGQGGDLAESALKRAFGVKDSGAVIPGHGGVMDRVDGLIAIAVVAALVGAARGGGEIATGVMVW